MVNKKNIVFVIPNLGAGGGEKSLVNLLNVIDFTKYNVDLILLHKTGLFLNMIPSNVNILEVEGDVYKIFTQGLIKSVLLSFKKCKFKLALNRILFAAKNNFIKNKAVAEQNSWKNLQCSIPVFQKKYDAAVAFLEKTSIYIITEKINSVKKIGWVHTNYSKSGLDKNFDYHYFNKLNSIVTISEECFSDLKNIFPNLKDKLQIIYNIVSPNLIKELSNESISDNHLFVSDENNILTISRLSEEKGIDIAIETCKILNERKINFKWFVIGDGNQRILLETKIKEYNLNEKFALLGLKQNPYPYFNKINLYVQPSRYEGKSIAIDEAKIFNKPIITTDYDTAKDQIKTNFNGIISSKNPILLADDIEKVLENKVLQSKLSANLQKETISTEKEIYKLYNLIGL